MLMNRLYVLWHPFEATPHSYDGGAEIPATDNEESFHCQLVTIAYVLWRGVSCDDGNDDAAVKYFLCNYLLVNRLIVSEEAVESV